MSGKETLVSEADWNGDIMGEFSLVSKKLIFSSVCKVAPKCNVNLLNCRLLFNELFLCKRGEVLGNKVGKTAREYNASYPVLNVSLAPGNLALIGKCHTKRHEEICSFNISLLFSVQRQLTLSNTPQKFLWSSGNFGECSTYFKAKLIHVHPGRYRPPCCVMVQLMVIVNIMGIPL